MSNNHTSGSGSGSSNSNSFISRREARASHITGALPIVRETDVGRSQTGSLNFEQMILSLHDLFERDRHIASQSDSTRCGICYLHFPLSELHYRDEGLYMCQQCEHALGKQTTPVIRRQQKL